MKKLVSIFFATLFLISFSCHKNINCQIDNEGIYFGQGIRNNFTIQLITVSKFNTAGIPVDFKETGIRADFINEVSRKIHKIYFFKKNENAHWNYQLTGRYDTIPMKFETKHWYLISSSEFKKGLFENVHVLFFAYKDNSNKFYLLKSSQAVSPI